MKTFAAISLLSITCMVCRAQIDFHPGYYLRNDGSRTACLIKDRGWMNNPTQIVCKSLANAASVTIGIDSITEFGVGNLRYQRFTIAVDISSAQVGDISHSPLPEFRQETAFLKLLVEGRASLYQYQNRGVTRFFMRLDGGQPRQLVNKEYLGDDDVIHANSGYIGQLRDSLACSSASIQDPTTVRYQASSLSRYFIAYNSCVKSTYTDYWSKAGKAAIHLNLRPGLDLASLIVNDHSNVEPLKYDYGAKLSFRIGAEAELMLPFNHNKWAITLEPEFRSYTSSSGGSGYQVDYKAIQLLLGARYYLFAGAEVKLYLSAGLFTNIPMQPTVQYAATDLAVPVRFGESFAAGLRFRDRVGVELSYSPPQQILDNYYYMLASLHTGSIIFSYRIF